MYVFFCQSMIENERESYMDELIREYGEVLVMVILSISIISVIGFLWTFLGSYMEYFSFALMGGG